MNIVIKEVLDVLEYGTLALCLENRPYSLPINFVEIDGSIYFHGSKKGRKIDTIKVNQFASFSAVEPYSIIDSDFSSISELACPATHFFKSVVIDGMIEIVESYEEKVLMLSSLMKKLQSKGGYKPLSNEVYKKAINATLIYKLVPDEMNIKLKFGQKLTNERYSMIIRSLKKRGSKKDMETIELMKKYYVI